jgi:arylsulfatase A-like enzyme
VPLVVRWPGRIPPGRRLGAPVEQVDVLPTLFDLLGIEASPGEFQGRSLAAALRGEGSLDPDRPVFLHRRDYAQQQLSTYRLNGQAFAVRLGRWKYIDRPDEQAQELYDLERDPDDRQNLDGTDPGPAAELAALLGRWRRERSRVDPVRAATDDNTRERLRALGYVE